jgi:hypothetical protein
MHCGWRRFLSFIDLERGGFGVIVPEVMIFFEGLCHEENIITEWNIAESPERRVYKWYIIPKVKELTNFRINFKTCRILTTRIQFLFSSVYLSFWRFLFKIFEHVSFGSFKVTYGNIHTFSIYSAYPKSFLILCTSFLTSSEQQQS